ncbi:hypothetical protein N7523_000839 [Penicillium sp. IBT 18751x]|nr:hypothetical protein N7523_000839 [Penicillium sp. IBT 18751x]
MHWRRDRRQIPAVKSAFAAPQYGEWTPRPPELGVVTLHFPRYDWILTQVELWLGSNRGTQVSIWRALLTDADPRRFSDGRSECPKFAAATRATVWRTAPDLVLVSGAGLVEAFLSAPSLHWGSLRIFPRPERMRNFVSTVRAGTPSHLVVDRQTVNCQPFLTALAPLQRALTHCAPEAWVADIF